MISSAAPSSIKAADAVASSDGRRPIFFQKIVDTVLYDKQIFLSYTNADCKTIREGIRRLGDLLKELAK